MSTSSVRGGLWSWGVSFLFPQIMSVRGTLHLAVDRSIRIYSHIDSHSILPCCASLSLSYVFPFRKKSCSEGNMLSSEDGPTPKPKKSQAGLSPISRKTSSSKSNENTSKQSKRSTQGLPVLNYSGQSSRLSASSASQSIADSCLTTVSP